MVKALFALMTTRETTRILSLLVFCTAAVVEAQTPDEFVISPTGTRPALCVNDSGFVGVVWQDRAIYYKRLDSLGNVLRDTLALSIGENLQDPRIGSSKSSEFVVWRTMTFFFSSYIRGRAVTLSGDTTDPEGEINDFWMDADRQLPQIAPLNDTMLLIVWNGNGPQTPSPSYGIYAQLISPTGAHLGTNFLVSDDTSLDQWNEHPSIAWWKNAPQFAVIWLDNYSRGNKIKARIFTSSGVATDSSCDLTSATQFNYVWSPFAAMHPNGEISLAWSAERSDSTWAIYHMRLLPDGTLVDAATSVNDEANPGSVPEVRLSVDEEGRLIIIWESKTDGKYRIKGQRFGPDGTRLGDNIILSSLSDTLSHYYPDVVLKNGRIYVVWQAGFDRIMGRFVDFFDTTLGTTPEGPLVPEEFKIFQNYPNPFNPSTSITFAATRAAIVDIAVFDIIGRKVMNLFQGKIAPGFHKIVWDVSSSQSIASGVYFCKFSAPGFSQTIKLILMR